MEIEQIRNMLRINKHRLDDELELQGQVAAEISSEVASWSAKVANLTENLKTLEAELLIELRSGDKITNDEIQARVRRDRGRRDLASSLDQAKYKQDIWIGLQDAWRQRSYALSTLANLYSSDYFEITKTSAGDRRSSHRPAYDPGPDRQAIREASAAATGSRRVRIGD